MRTFLALLALAGLLVGYQRTGRPTPAELAYAEFTRSLFEARTAEALAAAEGEPTRLAIAAVAREVDEARRAHRLGGVVLGEVSARQGPEGTVIEAAPVVRWDPLGLTGSIGSVRVFHRQRVVIARRGEVYRVVAFEDRVTDMRDWRGQPL